ncbi:ScyD/ScyE family protein [Actinophytocola gossypii]|uniref:ScyD/ScyE family protein n=1 Tax=Actinophytocola gossypii TaxID=2812003 RepID=A0ABT2JJT7_9PSEU|nr:ScyD/ScyE family protein [Actinophytocola gossypii]MCT2587650.1 ScyD/ScyE family protein [Actinophytocola gossypii]
MSKLRKRSLLVLAGVTALLVSGVTAASAAPAGHRAEPTLEVLASGLNNPRHLVVDRGKVWVAEAGVGGDLQCIITPEGEQCLGRSGAIVKVGRDGSVRRIIEGLPSLGAPLDGSYATGPADLALSRGKLDVLMSTSGIDPVTGANPFGDNGPEMGRLLRFDRNGAGDMRMGPDFGLYEGVHNPDDGIGAPPGFEIESNPYGMTPYRGGYAVVDAGGNDLLWVDRFGRVHTLAVFPAKDVDGRKLQSAPTAVEVGPDGALYVAELSMAPGTARVYRVVPGQEPEVYADGFTVLTDLAFDRRGRLLALSMTRTGAIFPPQQGEIVRIERDGSKTSFTPEGLISPTGIAVEGNTVYVSNQGVSPGLGEIVKLRLP